MIRDVVKDKETKSYYIEMEDDYGRRVFGYLDWADILDMAEEIKKEEENDTKDKTDKVGH